MQPIPEHSACSLRAAVDNSLLSSSTIRVYGSGISRFFDLGYLEEQHAIDLKYDTVVSDYRGFASCL